MRAPFECLRASAGLREQQPELQTSRCSSTGRDHTIYPIRDWSVRTLLGWWSTASGCSPGLKLGLGLATTSHITNVRFVPPYHPAVLQAGPENPSLQAAITTKTSPKGVYYRITALTSNRISAERHTERPRLAMFFQTRHAKAVVRSKIHPGAIVPLYLKDFC